MDFGKGTFENKPWKKAWKMDFGKQTMTEIELRTMH